MVSRSQNSEINMFKRSTEFRGTEGNLSGFDIAGVLVSLVGYLIHFINIKYHLLKTFKTQ